MSPRRGLHPGSLSLRGLRKRREAFDLYSLLSHSSHHPPGPTASEGPLCLRVTVFMDSCLQSMSSPFRSIPTTSISWGCHDSLPHTWGLQTTAIFSLTVLEATSPKLIISGSKSRCEQSCIPSKGSRAEASSSFSRLQAFLGYLGGS